MPSGYSDDVVEVVRANLRDLKIDAMVVVGGQPDEMKGEIVTA